MNASLRTSFGEKRGDESGDEVDGEEAHRILLLLDLDGVALALDAFIPGGRVGEPEFSSMIFYIENLKYSEYLIL